MMLNPSRRASWRATVLLPAPAGPSMAMIGGTRGKYRASRYRCNVARSTTRTTATAATVQPRSGRDGARSVCGTTGAGGNIGASIGDDGVALVDDQFAPLVPKLKAALAQLSKAPVRFVINTHWHGDHVGGNAQLAETAAILAHINVHKRMESGGKSP